MEALAHTAIDARKKDRIQQKTGNTSSTSGRSLAQDTEKRIEKMNVEAAEIQMQKKTKAEWGRRSQLIAKCRHLMHRYKISHTPSPSQKMSMFELEQALETVETEANIVSSRGQSEKFLLHILGLIETVCSPGPYSLPVLRNFNATGLRKTIMDDEEFQDIVQDFAGNYGMMFRSLGPVTRLSLKVGGELLMAKAVKDAPTPERRLRASTGMKAASEKFGDLVPGDEKKKKPPLEKKKKPMEKKK